MSHLNFLINKYLGCYLGRERREFQQGMDGHRENSGNKAMGEVMASSGILELNMRERKQLWVRSVFQGVTWERMGTRCGCGRSLVSGCPIAARLACWMDQLHQEPQSDTPVAGVGGQYRMRRSHYRQTCGKPEGTCPI